MTRARVGILGGGQLALMTAEAAPALDVEVIVVERGAGSPAIAVVGAANEIVGDWRDAAVREALASRVDLVTLENEFVDADALQALADAGCPVLPPPESVRLIQDKLRQKEALAAAGLPVVPFASAESAVDARLVGERLGWPLLLKARRNAYDGYGNATVREPAELESAVLRLGRGTGAGAAGGLYVEAWAPFTAELAMMVLRGRDGAILTFPLVETVQRDHICHEVIAPARVSAEIAERARAAAIGAVEATRAIGVVGVELFLLQDERVLVNELAPRPHNSGHYTIEACRTSQFEGHLRAVLGLPLGSTEMVAPAAAMVNLLGTTTGPAAPRGVEAARAEPDTFVHIYGKREVRVGRKMGHVTALGATRDEAIARARRVAEQITW